MIRVGNQTSCWAPSPAEPFDYAVSNGFDAFEWFPDKKPGVGWDDSDLDTSQRRKIKEAAKQNAIRLSVHARWQANPLRPDAAELLRKDLRLAKDLDAVLLNIHLYQEAGIDRFISAITPLIHETADVGLQLSIENTPEHSPEQFNELFNRLRELDSVPVKHIGMCLDLGHANLSGATPNDYLRFIDRLDQGVPIIHLHLHENWGDGDTHLTLFTGPAGQNDSGICGFVERMRKRKFSGSIILEQWPQPPTLLNEARDRLLELFGHGDTASKDSSRPEDKVISASAVGTSGPASVSATKVDAETASKGKNDPKALTFVQMLVEGDKRARSWREKLEAVRELIVSKHSLDEAELVYIAIYLRFLSAGQIACSEDGRHFRPGHHARISQEIQERLAKAEIPENAYIIRQIYARLPSSAQQFQSREPLTRIRDIAHRNDIPSELKREIKTTLQNKLHRCAGPEDLETSKRLLERIIGPGANCAPEFVEQFRIFHKELEEFFNARTLDDRLNTLIHSVDSKQGELIREFLESKSRTGFEEQLSTLKRLTHLRELLEPEFQKQTLERREEFLLVDIALEDFAFVVSSQLINAFESFGSNRTGADMLEPLALIVRNLAIGGIAPDECEAVNAELKAWRENFDSANAEQLLRMKATIERGRRIADSFSGRVISETLAKVAGLGRALRVTEHAIRVFGEAEIRSHLVFQLSKIASFLLKGLRGALGLPGWDVLVSGHVSGRVNILEQLEDLRENGAEPKIVVLKKAQGDEEIPTSVRGILLAHEIPHLSHLGVRARQAGVVFAGAEVESDLDELKHLQGEAIRLEAAPDRLNWVRIESDEHAISGAFAGVRPTRKKINAVSLRKDDALIIPLDHVRVENGGQKAFGVRRLKELTAESGKEFLVPPAQVIPFGVMERSLSTDNHLETEYWKLADELDSQSVEGLETKAEHLQTIIGKLRVPDEITSTILRNFRTDDRLMIRSSANCEDLEDFAGAGLYESIPNISPQEVAPAMLRVWSSLWTKRAVLSRCQAAIPHKQAQMAVIIQQMVGPDYSFVLHTINPLNKNKDELYAELAVGLGETLASAATRGTPYRLVCNKRTGEMQTLAFANFSHAIRADSKGGVGRELLDYSRISLSRDSNVRRAIGRQLAAIGRRLEMKFEKPQDVEGAIMDGNIYLVQSRPQQGL